MVDHDITISFMVISDLYERYTVVVNTTTKSTSVYCEECDEWVGRWDGDQLSKHSIDDLKELIVDEHEEQVLGQYVEIADDTVSFK